VSNSGAYATPSITTTVPANPIIKAGQRGRMVCPMLLPSGRDERVAIEMGAAEGAMGELDRFASSATGALLEDRQEVCELSCDDHQTADYSGCNGTCYGDPAEGGGTCAGGAFIRA